MIRGSTLALVVAFAAAATAVPAMAQSRAHRPSVARRAPHKTKAPERQSTGPLYNTVPAPTNRRDDPAFTGGGSIGYNQMIYNW